MRNIILFILLASFPLFSQNSYSLRSTMDDSSFKYTIDQDGDLKIDYTTRTGRKQPVVIREKTNSFQNVHIREVLSVAWSYKDKTIPDNLAGYLLIDNFSTKYLGNWGIFKSEDQTTIIFIVKIPYDSNRLLLEAAITEAAEAADSLEKALEDEMKE